MLPIGSDPRDASFTVGQVLSLSHMRRACGTKDYEVALLAARQAVTREQETIEADRKLREHGARRFVDQTVASPELKALLMDLSDLPDDVRARLVDLRNRGDMFAFAAAVGTARDEHAKRSQCL